MRIKVWIFSSAIVDLFDVASQSSGCAEMMLQTASVSKTEAGRYI